MKTGANTSRATTVVLFVATLGAAFSLKRYYAHATTTDLDWILRPTARIVGGLCGSRFAQNHDGYANASLQTIIVPACAGVNYLVVVFSMLVFGFVGKAPGARRQLALTAAFAAAAYVSTIGVNAVRIAAGIFVRHHAARASEAALEQAHRVEGVLVYLTSLWLIYWVAETLLRRASGAPAGAR